jgi:hypothetical protein
VRMARRVNTSIKRIDGSLTGLGGGLGNKEELLTLERVQLRLL